MTFEQTPCEGEKKVHPDMSARMRGDAALAWGAKAAGVSLVTGYPGSPATGVFDTLLEMLDREAAYVRWAPNEKVAMEMGIGASLAGHRALVVLKSVGLNVGLDPLATASLAGAFGGLVILLGDDPGAWGSQNEQDSRWLARVAEVPVIEPTNIAEAANLMVQAYAWSEAHHLPLIVRITRAFALATGIVQSPWTPPPPPGVFPRQHGRWVVLPDNVVKRRRTLHRRLREFARDLEGSPYDRVTGDGTAGVLAVGNAQPKMERMLAPTADLSRMSLSSTWPLPEAPLVEWLQVRERVLVIEEGSPFVEQAVRALVARLGLQTTILGRDDRVVPEEGELEHAALCRALLALQPALTLHPPAGSQRTMPSKTALCPECGYRPLLGALIEAMNQRGGRNTYIVVGEAGCMVRAHLPPLELFDVKYSLGASLGLGLGLALSGTRQRVVALVGDSALYHSEINTLPQIVDDQPPMTVVILDNQVTALTGGQAHPGSPHDERGSRRDGHDIVRVLEGFGIAPKVVCPERQAQMQAALQTALATSGPAFVVARVPCATHTQRGDDA